MNDAHKLVSAMLEEKTDCASIAWRDYRARGGQLVTISAPGFYGDHAMVLRDGKYYDCYAPEGVTDFMDSPWFNFLKKPAFAGRTFAWRAQPMDEGEFADFWSGQYEPDA